MPTSVAATQAAEFIAEATRLGFSVEATSDRDDAVVTVSKSFTPGDAAAYVAADGDAPHLLYMVPTVTYGSTWGTDGASVGGHAGMSGGYYRLSKSGVSKRFAAAVRKAVTR